MKIFFGADHAGLELKNEIKDFLNEREGIEIEDLGAQTLDEEDDYPGYAFAVAKKVASNPDAKGILVCGSGQGMSIAANRIKGVRAALAWDEKSATASKTDDDANVLVLPARFIDKYQAQAMVDAWLSAEFKTAPKYHRRLDEIEHFDG